MDSPISSVILKGSSHYVFFFRHAKLERVWAVCLIVSRSMQHQPSKTSNAMNSMSDWINGRTAVQPDSPFTTYANTHLFHGVRFQCWQIMKVFPSRLPHMGI